MAKLLAFIGISIMLPIAAASHSASADYSSPIFLQFKETSGTYKLQAESINQLERDPETKKATSYRCLAQAINEVTCNNQSTIVLRFINMPKTATHLRISIRKKGVSGTYGRGGFFFINLEQNINTSEQWTINVINQFSEIAKGNSKGVTITSGPI